MTRISLLMIVALLAVGCGEAAPVEPDAEVKNGPKLSAEQAQAFQGIIPGGRHRQGSQSGVADKKS